MSTWNDYKLLRETSNKSDDTDWVGGNPQTLPTTTVQLVGPSSAPRGARIPLKVEVVLEWLNSDGTVDTTARGTFDIAGIRVMERNQIGPKVVGASSVAGSTTKCAVDTATLTGQIGYRPIIIDELMVGDEFTVRLTNMVQAGADKARVLYREIH